jgi:hypothetical protein
MTATPDTTCVVNRTANAAYGGAAVVQVWRGVDTTTRYDVTRTTSQSTNNSRFDPPAITPVTAGAVIVVGGIGTQTTAGAAFTIPSGWSTYGISVKSDGTTSDTGIAIGSKTDWTSGAFDPAAVTGGTSTTSSGRIAVTIALRPAPTEATGTLSSSVGVVTLSATGVAPFGKLYYVIYPSAASAPSATQIKAGQQQSGAAATASGNEWANATTGEQIFASDATGLTAGTSYRIAFVWNYDTLDSNVVVSDAWSTTGSAGPTGTLSLSIGDVTLSATGSVAADGTLSLSIGDIVLASLGTIAVDGTLSSSVGDLSLSATGAVAVDGDLSSSVGDITLSATGELVLPTIEGTLSSTVSDITLSATGAVAVAGILDRNLGNPISLLTRTELLGQIKFVGHDGGAREGSLSTFVDTLGTLVNGLSTSPQEGDLILVSVAVASQGRTPDCSISGWTTVGAQLNESGTTYDTSIQVSYMVAGPTPPTTVEIPATGHVDDAQGWTIFVLRDVHPSVILDVARTTATGTGTTRSNPPAITPVTPGAWVLSWGAGAGYSLTGASATGAGLVRPRGQSWFDVNPITHGGGYLPWSGSGPVDPGEFSNGADDAGYSWASISIAIRPNAIDGDLSSSVGDVALSAAGATVADGTLTQATGDLQLAASGLAVVSGTLTQGTGEIALSAAAQALVDGTLDQLVGSVVITAAGEVLVTGTLSSSIGSLTLTADGIAGTFSYGTLDSSVGDITLSAAGTVAVAGTLDRSIGVLTLSGAGTIAVSGALSSSVGDVVLTGLAAVDIVGNLMRAIGDVALTGEADLASLGVLDQAVGDVTLSAAGAVAVAGTLDLSTGAVALTAAGGAQITGTLTQSIGNLQLLATGVTPVVGSLSASIGTIALPAEGVVGSLPVVGSLDSSIGDILLTDAQGLVFSSEESSDWLVRLRREAVR